MGNDVASDIHCDVTKINDIAIYVYIMASQCIMTLLNLLCINMPIYGILLWVVWNKNRNKFIYNQSGLENTFIIFV